MSQKANISGTNPLPDRIQNVQNQTDNYDVSHIICNSNGTIEIKGQVVFNPPLPIDSTKISSNDQTAQVECLDGGQIIVQGDINMQNNKMNNLANPIQQQDPVTLNYLQQNYDNSQQTQQSIGIAISGLESVYMPIGRTLDQIPIAQNDVNLNNNKITNLSPGTQPTDAVNFSQLDGLLPITTNLNSLQQQTANYDTNGFQLTVTAVPQQNEDLTNKQYVDGQITQIQNNYVSNQSLGTTLQDYQTIADMQNYYTKTASDNLFATISSLANYLTISSFNSQIANYVTISSLSTTLADYVTLVYLQANYLSSTVINNTFATISSLSNYLTISSFNSQIVDYVTLVYLQANYLTSTTISSTFATISSLSNYVTNNSLTQILQGYYTSSYIDQTFQTIASMANYVNLTYLTSNYYTQTQTDNTFQTQAAMFNYPTFTNLTTQLSNYYTIYNANQVFQTIADMVNYVTNSSLATTLSSYVTNSSLATTLSGYLTTSSASSTYQPLATAINTSNIANYQTEIKNTAPIKSRVSCASNTQILFDVLDVQKMRIYTPAGQSPDQPTGIEVPQKLQFVTGENSVSITGSKALIDGQQNGTGLYIKTPYSTTNDLFTQVCVQPSSSNCQNLTMSSGQVNLPGLGMTQYSTICNGAGGVQQNLQISASLPNLGDQTLNFYSNSYASSIGQNLTAQFTGKVGYSSAVAVTETNQFSSKSYVDSLISGLSSVYQTITAFNSAISNYYNKTQSDARYYLNTTTLNNITQSNGNLLIGDGTTNYQIKNVLDPSQAQDVATKNYVDTQSASGITLATGKANFYTLDGTNSVLPSATLNMNNQLISNVQDPINQQDAMNLQTSNANYVLKTTVLNDLTAPTGSLSLNNQKITGLQSGTNTNDGVNFGQLTTTNNNISTISSSLSTFQAKFKTGTVVIGNYNNSTTSAPCTSFSGIITAATKRLSGNSPAELIDITYTNFGTAPYIFISQSSVGASFRANGIVTWLANSPGVTGATFYCTTAGNTTIATSESLGTLQLFFVYAPL